MLTPVSSRNGVCLAKIAQHADRWLHQMHGHEQLRKEITGMVEGGRIYQRLDPTLQPMLVEVISSVWEPGAGKDAFKVGYVPIGLDASPIEPIIEPTVDFIVRFELVPEAPAFQSEVIAGSDATVAMRDKELVLH